jgi:uncharacterized RmlC-like cupin family protein
MNGRNRTTATRPAGWQNVAGERCRVVRAGAGYEGLQGLSYSAGIFTESAGARRLCLHTLVIPPGGRARAHPACPARVGDLHRVRGERDVVGCRPHPPRGVVGGDFVYIPAGVSHLPGNPSAAEQAVAVVARTDPNEQESVVLLPHLDDVPEMS